MLVDNLYNEKFDSISDSQLVQTINLLKSAIIDWPTNVRTVEDFIREVETFLKGQPITIDNIEHKTSVVRLNEAWQIEALTSINELMKINQRDPLVNILRGYKLLS